MIQGILLQEPIAKYSENIINSYMTFNDEFTYDFTSGIGVATVENSTENPLIGQRSMKIRALTTGTCTFNAADKSNSTVKVTGIHYIQFQAFKPDPTADMDLTLNVYINDVLTSSRTITQNLYNTSGFIDGVWNNYYQSFLANAGDVISLSWTFHSDTEDAVLYLDGFKIECNDQALIAPTIYTNPIFLINKWSRLYNFTDTQTLAVDTATNFSSFEGTFESNCGSEILVEGVGFKPTRLNSFFTVNINFLAKVPSGSDIHIDARLNINGTTYMGDTQFLNKPVADYQYVNILFNIPCNAEFLEFDGAVELTAKGNSIEISRRMIVVSEQVNQN